MWPFMVIYLSSVRGMPVASAGMVMSVAGVAGVLATPISGLLSDRFGPQKIVAVSLAMTAGAALGFARVSVLGPALLWAAVAGAGLAAMWNAFAALLVGIVPVHARTDVFGVAYALQNLGTGLGAAAAGALLDIRVPATFERTFVASFVIFGTLAALILAAGKLYEDRPGGGSGGERADQSTGESGGHSTGQSGGESGGEPAGPRGPSRIATGGVRVALTDRTLRVFVLLNLSFAVTLVALQTLTPLWVVGPLSLPASLVGAIVSANTATIVVAQSFTLRLIRGRSRMMAISLASSLLALATVVYLSTGLIASRLLPVALVTAAAIAGFGLTFFQPSIAGMLNDLAPANLRGTYNAALNSAWQAGAVVAPSLAGLFAAGGRFYEAFAGIFVAQVLIAVGAQLSRKSVPRHIDLGARNS